MEPLAARDVGSRLFAAGLMVTVSAPAGYLPARRPSLVDVVDTGHTLKLADHVGRRVSVTGPLVDREMRARSLRRVASSCLQQP